MQENIMEKQFQLILQNKSSLKIQGVKKIKTVQSDSCLLETQEGPLLLHGEEIEVFDFNQEKHTAEIHGTIYSFQFTKKGEIKKKDSSGFWKSVF